MRGEFFYIADKLKARWRWTRQTMNRAQSENIRSSSVKLAALELVLLLRYFSGRIVEKPQYPDGYWASRQHSCYKLSIRFGQGPVYL